MLRLRRPGRDTTLFLVVDEVSQFVLANKDRLDRLRRGLKGRAEVRPTSARWAWIEWVLAQGGEKAGRAVYDATKAGGRFADYQRAFEAAEVVPRRKKLSVLRSEAGAGS